MSKIDGQHNPVLTSPCTSSSQHITFAILPRTLNRRRQIGVEEATSDFILAKRRLCTKDVTDLKLCERSSEGRGAVV